MASTRRGATRGAAHRPGTAIVTTIVATSQGALTAGDGEAYVAATRTGTWHGHLALTLCGVLALACAAGMIRARRAPDAVG